MAEVNGFERMGQALRRILWGYDDSKENDKGAIEAVEKVTGRKIDKEVVDGKGSGLLGEPLDKLFPDLTLPDNTFVAVGAAILVILLLKD